MNGLKDRLRNSDAHIGKSGEIIRKPIGGRDIAVITGVLFDKRALLRHQPTSISGKVDTEKQLEELGRILEKGVDTSKEVSFFWSERGKKRSVELTL